MSLGIKNLAAVEFYVNDLERARDMLVSKLDFAEVAASGDAWHSAHNARSLLFEAGACRLLLSSPTGPGRVQHYLSRHPEGIGAVYFEVREAQRALEIFESRGGTPISDVVKAEAGEGHFGMFSATTPFGEAHFNFFDRERFKEFLPGLIPHAEPTGGTNRYNFVGFDHMTSNFTTLAPAVLWMEHVLGMERYWDIQFHTKDVSQQTGHAGSGLKSIVMWDPESGVKFANNEPLRPHFDNSQISVFCNDNQGAGIQHLALTVPFIEDTVSGLRESGVDFLHTPGNYYDALPVRLAEVGIDSIDEDIDSLRQLGILVDGEGKGKYLLQIFLKELATLHDDSQAGPFFFEIIQRKGARGFGGGNFRALFESIEREQITE